MPDVLAALIAFVGEHRRCGELMSLVQLRDGRSSRRIGQFCITLIHENH